MISKKAISLEVEEVRRCESFRIEKPVKAHLIDGSMIIYRSGFTAVNDTIVTLGIKYNFTREDSTAVEKIALTEIAYIEYYRLNFHWEMLLSGASQMFIILAVMAYAAAMSAIGAMGA